MGLIVDPGINLKIGIDAGESFTVRTRGTATIRVISGMGLAADTLIGTVVKGESTFGPYPAGFYSVLALGEHATVRNFGLYQMNLSLANGVFNFVNPLTGAITAVGSGSGTAAPGQPAKPVLTALAGSVSLAWTAGAANGGTINRNEFLDINGVTTILTTNPQVITATAGTPYTGAVRSRNSDGTYGAYSAQADSVTPTAVVVTPTYLTSAAVRSKLPLGTGTGPTNNVRTSRLAEYAVTPVTNPVFDFANVYVNASLTTAAQEIISPTQVPVSASVLTGVSGTALDQSAATLTPLTFNNAANCVAGYIVKLDGTNMTSAEFTSGAGAISGDGLQFTPPTNCAGYTSDPATGVTLNGTYFVQTEIVTVVGSPYLSTTVAGTRTDLGDQIKDSTARTGVFVKNWTTIGTTSAGMTFGPCGVHGTSATGVKTIGIAGDSIANDNFDRDTTTSRYGDAQGATNFIGRALNNRGYPFARAAISGSNAINPYTYGGYAMRQRQLRHCSAIFTDMGHNDRGSTFANIMVYLRAHWAKLRQAGVGGNPKIIQTNWAPLATSTDLWATKANQTPSTIAGSMQFDSFNPFIKNGVFNVASGDCDAGYDFISDIYTAATNLGATDVTPGYVPTNGTANYFWNDSTHPTSILHAAVGAPLLGPKLAALIGF